MTEPTSVDVQNAPVGSCCGSCSTDTSTSAQAGAVTATYTVSGMTCQHCAAAVSQEINAMVSGVREVDVDLDSGRVTVTSDGPVDGDTVRSAVAEAGYQLAS